MRRGPYQTDLGVQAHYEFNRRIAPYVSVSRTWHPGAEAGGKPSATWLRAGLRLIF